MSSYDGIIRIRLKGRSSVTSSQPATQAPLTLFVLIYTPYSDKIQGVRKNISILFIICYLFEQIIKPASNCIVIMIRAAYLIPDMIGSVCFKDFMI